MKKDIGKQIHEIKQNMEDEELLSKASDEELMGYIFLSEKINKKIEKLEKMAHKKNNIQQ